MKFHPKAAFIASISALPLMALATWFWMRAQEPSGFSDMLYLMGDAGFQLGFPLTTIVYLLFLAALGGAFTRESEVWALPLLNFAFLLQWIIWSQLIIFWKARKLK
jgi:hypothetical protein